MDKSKQFKRNLEDMGIGFQGISGIFGRDKTPDLGDLFGNGILGNDYEDMFETILGPKRTNANTQRRTNATQTPVQDDAECSAIKYHLEKKNRQDLSNLIMQHYSNYLGRRNDDCQKTYAKACFFVGNTLWGLEVMTRISDPTESQKEAMGIAAYALGNLNECASRLHGIRSRYDFTPLLRSIALYETGHQELAIHASILKPIVAKSAKANVLLGIMHYNKGYYQNAEQYFIKARTIDPKSRQATMGLLRTYHALGYTRKEVELMYLFSIFETPVLKCDGPVFPDGATPHDGRKFVS